MHWCYILYSPTIDKFYVGETENLEIRITQHRRGFFKNSIHLWLLIGLFIFLFRAETDHMRGRLNYLLKR